MTPRAITNRGWAWLLVSGFVLASGMSLGWAEFIGLGVAGLVTFGFASLYALVRHAHDVSFQLATTRVTVGEQAQVQVSVHNPTHRRLPALELYISVNNEQLSCDVGRLRREATVNTALQIPTGHRDVVTVGPARAVHQDPLGLISREVRHGASTTLFVHPRTVALKSMSTGFVRDLEGNPTTDLTDSDLSFHALREYLPGDDRRNIHWKSTAKTGQFMVRQFEQTRRSHLMIVLDAHPDSYTAHSANSREAIPGDAEFELAVSAAASLAIRAIRDTRDVSVLVGAASPRDEVARIRALSTVSSDRVLDQFSAVSLTPGAPALISLSRQAAASAADVSVAFLVTGPQVTMKTLNSASASFPQGVEVVILSCAPEATPTVKRIDRLSVATIGRLDDVFQLLSKGMGLS